jgi:hypothetical protein
LNYKENVFGANMNVGGVEIVFGGHKNQEGPQNLVETMRSLRVEVQRCIVENETLIRAQEEQN